MRDMKESGIAWVGTMPTEWNIKRGKFALQLLNRPILDADEVITCFRDGEVTLRKNRREEGFTVSLKEIGYQGIEPGDLVVHGMDGFAGSIGISDSRGKSSPVLVVCDSDEDKRYIMYYLRSMAYNDVFTALATGIRVRSCDLRWNKIAELPFILPSKDEQARIVQAIAENTAKIDALIANVEGQIEKLKAYKKSIITETITMGLNSSVEMKDSGVDLIGKIPTHYRVAKIKSVCSNRISDGTHSTPEYTTEDAGFPFLSSKDVRSGTINWTDIKYITMETHEQIKRNISPQFGDVLLSKNGSIGFSAVVDTEREFDIYVTLALLRPNQLVLSKYLKYALDCDTTQKQFALHLIGIGVPNLHLNVIQDTKIILPPMDEQQEMVRYLDEMCSKIERLIAIKQNKIDKLAEYKKSLIYEYVTGKKEVS